MRSGPYNVTTDVKTPIGMNVTFVTFHESGRDQYILIEHEKYDCDAVPSACQVQL